MLSNVETVVAELNELKAYRQQKFHALTYVVKIEAGKEQEKEAKVQKDHCDFLRWLDKENRREELTAVVGEKHVNELCQLHELWFDDYKKVYTHFYEKKGLLSGLFSGAKRSQEQDKVASYFNDLKMTNDACDKKIDKMAIQLRMNAH